MEKLPQYPTDERGLAIHPFELELPETRIPDELLDVGEPYVNNHHRYYQRNWYVGSILLNTFRQLETHIDPMPIDSHRILHQRFFGVRIPEDTVVMELVEEAYETGVMVMQGHTTKNPRPINDARMKAVRKDYSRRKNYGK